MIREIIGEHEGENYELHRKYLISSPATASSTWGVTIPW